tara:strand:+ start:184 stop:459 length:276 start_codon:yes stop_codon:yes gene_type:complete
MKLFLIHVGFYDMEIMEGLYEQHSNFFVVARDVKEAKKKARLNPLYKRKKMHIDGIQEISVVDGFRISLNPEKSDSNDIATYSYDKVKKIK